MSTVANPPKPRKSKTAAAVTAESAIDVPSITELSQGSLMRNGIFTVGELQRALGDPAHLIHGNYSGYQIDALRAAMDEVAEDLAATAPVGPAAPTPAPTPATAGSTAPSPRQDEVKLLALTAIAPSRFNPRKTMKGLEELAASIRVKGVVQPIIVRPLPKNGAGLSIPTKRGPGAIYELVCGERRWRASEIAQAKTIPAIVRELSDKDVLEIQVIENDQRQDPDPLDQAHGYRRMMDEAGYTVASLAQKIGRSESYVYARLQLTKLSKKWQGMLAAGDIQLGHGELVARLNEKDQDELHQECFRWSRDTTISVTELRQTIEREFVRDVKAAPWLGAETSSYKQGLDGPVGPFCCVCQKRSGFQPGLFPDINKKRDICMDRACFESKRVAFVQLKVKRLEAEGQKPVQVSISYSSPAKGVLALSNYEIIPKKDVKKARDATPAVVYDGNEAGSIVHVKVRRRELERASRQPSQQEFVAKQKEQRERQAMTRAVAREALEAAFSTINTPAPAKLFARFLLSVMKMPGEEIGYIAKQMKLKWPPYGPARAQAFLRLIEAADEETLHQMYLVALFDNAFMEWGAVNLKDLGETLEPYGVDVPRLLEMHKAQAALRKDEKPAKKKAKKSKS